MEALIAHMESDVAAAGGDSDGGGGAHDLHLSYEEFLASTLSMAQLMQEVGGGFEWVSCPAIG